MGGFAGPGPPRNGRNKLRPHSVNGQSHGHPGSTLSDGGRREERRGQDRAEEKMGKGRKKGREGSRRREWERKGRGGEEGRRALPF